MGQAHRGILVTTHAHKHWGKTGVSPHDVSVAAASRLTCGCWSSAPTREPRWLRLGYLCRLSSLRCGENGGRAVWIQSEEQ
eukprot:2780486-Amphidinium_carterae.1